MDKVVTPPSETDPEYMISMKVRHKLARLFNRENGVVRNTGLYVRLFGTSRGQARERYLADVWIRYWLNTGVVERCENEGEIVYVKVGDLSTTLLEIEVDGYPHLQVEPIIQLDDSLW